MHVCVAAQLNGSTSITAAAPTVGPMKNVRQKMTDSLKAEIDKTDALILQEMEHWQKMKVDPAEAVNINTFMLDSYVFALGEYLQEKGLIVGEEFTLKYKQKLLENLRMHRENVKQIIHQQQILVPKNHGRLQ